MADRTLAPYKIEKRGGKYCVVNNAGEVKARFSTREAALAYQRALYANVPGAGKRADKKKFSGKERLPKWAKDAKEKSASNDKVEPVGTNQAKPAKDMKHPVHKTPPPDTPAHIFVQSQASPGCLVCGADPEDDIHSIDRVNKEREEFQNRHGMVAKAAEPVAQRGTMVALFPDNDTAKTLASPEGEKAKDLHVTLAYLPDIDPDVTEEAVLNKLLATVEGYARTQKPLTGQVAGQGKFIGDKDGTAHYASVDLPGLPEFRQQLVRVLAHNGFKVADNHGFTPHMTLSYGDEEPSKPVTENHPLEFSELWVASGDKRWNFPIGTEEADEGDETTKSSLADRMADFIARAKAFGEAREAAVTANGPMMLDATHGQEWREAARIAAGIDACVDQALVLMRSTDETQLPENILQARDLIGVIEPACDDLLDFFGVDDPDDMGEDDDAQPETASKKKGKHRFVSARGIRRGTAGWYGPCAICGNKPKDPDHDMSSGSSIDPDNDGDNDSAEVAVESKAAFAQRALEALRRNAETRAYDEAFRVNRGIFALPERSLKGFDLPSTKAFIAQVGDRTMLTAPASTFQGAWESAATPNQYFLWMQGAFVGGEVPNRNNALWKTADLEMGQPTVKHGPLNWLHESKHVIGSIADSKLVTYDHAADQPLEEPYIAALAGIWRWIYPDEAAVVEMASDAERLWYSMECVSRTITCVGDAGCGQAFPYMDVMQSKANVCGHLKDRSSVRHLNDPTFLGGAVIVPPVRPGWAKADARVMQTAASLAEKAYEQAGRPDMTTSEWEQLMAQVVLAAS